MRGGGREAGGWSRGWERERYRQVRVRGESCQNKGVQVKLGNKLGSAPLNRCVVNPTPSKILHRSKNRVRTIKMYHKTGASAHPWRYLRQGSDGSGRGAQVSGWGSARWSLLLIAPVRPGGGRYVVIPLSLPLPQATRERGVPVYLGTGNPYYLVVQLAREVKTRWTQQ